MSEIPNASLSRLLKKAGAERISKDAIDEFADVVEEFAVEVAEVAVRYARHTGRKTVKADDIKLATK